MVLNHIHVWLWMIWIACPLKIELLLQHVTHDNSLRISRCTTIINYFGVAINVIAILGMAAVAKVWITIIQARPQVGIAQGGALITLVSP